MSDGTKRIKQTIDTCEDDREFIRRLEGRIRMLSGMVIEMVEENPSYLLSSVMREALVEKARQVEELMDKVNGKLCVDNPTVVCR